MKHENGKRPLKGVVVTLQDMGDGTSRIIMDNVIAETPCRDTSWTYDLLFTHKRLSSTAIDDLALPATEYQGMGEALMARLLALNGRVR